MANYIEIAEPKPSRPRLDPQEPQPKKSKWLLWVILLALALGGIWLYTHRPVSNAAAEAGKGGGRRGGNMGPVNVVAGAVVQKDVPIYLEGIGTIQALNTVTVRARVDGQLEKVDTFAPVRPVG